jgi:hypothetical protein
VRATVCFAALFFLIANTSVGQDTKCPVGQDTKSPDCKEWLTVSANLDGAYRKTQFFAPNYNTGVFQWDSRVEVWIPPSHRWGPYLRVAGIAGSEPNAWQNGWLGAPGFGGQVYPLAGFLGPLRVFGEYNFMHYWGEDFPGQGTSWRPRNQARAGFDYWKAVNVNAPEHYWWLEVWNGLYWQSANEFTDRYDSVVFANSGRFGIRKADSGAISAITPYVAVESSLSKYRHTGIPGCFLVYGQGSRDPNNPCDFFWENRLLAGGGLRFAPSMRKLNCENKGLLTRFVIYGEYLNTATYYGPRAPSSFPRFDVLVGVSANIGSWYK